MRVAFDECIPHDLLGAMPEAWTCAIVQKIGYAGFRDGSLLDLFESEYDVLVTFDKGLSSQNNLTGRRLGILRIDLKRNSYPTLAAHHERIVTAILTGIGRTLTLTRDDLEETAR